MLGSGTYVSAGPVEVSKAMQDGEKFIKWDEVSTSTRQFIFVNIACFIFESMTVSAFPPIE